MISCKIGKAVVYSRGKMINGTSRQIEENKLESDNIKLKYITSMLDH